MDSDSAIPAELIRNCSGLAFLTVVKAGMIWTGKLGTGVVIARLEDGSWSAPSGIGTAGVGFGAEIGGEIIDFMIVLGSPSAVKTFKKGTQVSVGAGLDLAVGPVGRTAGANMNAGKGGLSGNYTYSRSKGIFAGIGLHGSTIMVRGEMNHKFYGREVSPMEILSGHVQPPAGTCDCLYEAIRQAENQESRSSIEARSPHYTTDTLTRGSSQRASASSRTNSFDRSSFNSTGSATSQPIDNDPRLRKSTLYRTQEEMLAEYAKNKGTQSATTTYGGATAAAAASTAYAASSAYSTPQAPSAPTPAYSTPQPTTYQPNAPQPLPRPVTYSSYSVPAVGAPAVRPQPPPPIPTAAVGAETKEVYMQVMNFISTRCPHANLQTFKDNCRLFGQDQMALEAYFAYLVSLCSTNLLKELMPQLVRLLPTAEKRERLWALYVRDVLLIR